MIPLYHARSTQVQPLEWSSFYSDGASGFDGSTQSVGEWLGVPCADSSFHKFPVDPALNALLFCDRKGIARFVNLSVAKLPEFFLVQGPIELRVLTDPDSGEEYLEMSVNVQGDPESVADAYDQYVHEWFSKLPVFAQQVMRLSLDVG